MAGEWCTPPDSPNTSHVGVSSSYEHAVRDSDWYWDWEHDLREEKTFTDDVAKLENVTVSSSLPAVIRHGVPVESILLQDQPPAHVTSVDNMTIQSDTQSRDHSQAGFDVLDSSSGVVLADNGHTTVGFMSPCDLGTRSKEVILSPPSSASYGRPRSIEEVGHSLTQYAPSGEEQNNALAEELAVPFCLNYLSSFGEQMEVDSDGAASSIELQHFHKDDPGELQDGNSCYSNGTGNPYTEFTQSCTCYDMMPNSIKMVVLDRRLPVKKAFFALVQNGVRAAPVWNSNCQEFVGMLTISDFVNILIFHYKSPIVEMDELEEQTIQMWRESVKQVANLKPTLIRIDPMESLYGAVKMLVENKIHRLPVIDCRTGDAVYIMTHKRLLHYICLHLIDGPQPSFMEKPLQQLGIGTYQNIATATRETPLIVALKIFAERRISALPIVDDTGKVVDIYAKFDVINLAAERTYNNLDITLHKALQHRAEGFEGVHTCQLRDTLYTIVKRIVFTQVHRLVVVDNDKHVIGVLSLSDLLSFLVLQPCVQTALST